MVISSGAGYEAIKIGKNGEIEGFVLHLQRYTLNPGIYADHSICRKIPQTQE
jgi:hypothetical protein